MRPTIITLFCFAALSFGATDARADAELVTQGEFAARARSAEALAERMHRVKRYQAKLDQMRLNQGVWQKRGPAVQIPELDPASSLAGLALLFGGLTALTARRKPMLSAS